MIGTFKGGEESISRRKIEQNAKEKSRGTNTEDGKILRCKKREAREGFETKKGDV